MWEEYLFPRSIQEALEILKSYKGQARIIAGGTDLILELKDRTRTVKCLVDIREIDALKNIEQDGEEIKIGAGVTHSQIASSMLIQRQATVLAEAASAVGSPQIRNQGTVVGNVVSAQPAADTAVALFALEAEAEITISGKALSLQEGEMVIMPANEPHALKAIKEFKMMLVMIRS